MPDICQDLCRGEYTMQEDRIQSHFSCTAYTEATLMCISEGIGESAVLQVEVRGTCNPDS